MQADQILFLRPAQTEPAGNAVEVSTDALPDVVLEVDNTTDVRRNKLKLYESWGFREVWVEVPEEPQPRPPGVVESGADDPCPAKATCERAAAFVPRKRAWRFRAGRRPRFTGR